MDLIVVDLETYYDQQYSLSKLTTEEYIRDPRFSVIGVGTKVNDEPTQWVTGPAAEVVEHLRTLPWDTSMLLAHNTMFDGAILSWRCGIRPKALGDTMLMSRALFGTEVSHSLKAVAERYGVGEKGDEVVRALGKRRDDFTPEEMARYGQYCVNDVGLTYDIFQRMLAEGFPLAELKLIDVTLRMFTEPMLELDGAHLRTHLKNVRDRKQSLLDAAGVTDKKDLMSNQKFAEMLRGFGVEPPMKISPTTGKETYAFAKTDEEFKALEEHEDDRVQTLVAARLGNKSTLEETRTERFLQIASRGKLPIPLRYCGALSHRWAGADKINLQNLPSRGANAKQIKQSIVAPSGYVLIDADSAQIEARVLAWLAEQEDVVATFAANGDVYKRMASQIFDVPEGEVTKEQRQIGKVVVLGCFGPDTEVLTRRGWVRIVQVQATDRVWDGEEWVAHGGVIPQGEKTVLTQYGVSATLDHEILTEHGWAAWSEVCENPRRFRSALRLGSSRWLSGSATSRPADAPWGGSRGANAAVAGRGSCIERTSFTVGLRAAMAAQKLRLTLSGIGNTAMRVLTMLHASACSTAFRPALPGAITPRTPTTVHTAGGASTFGLHGEQTGQYFCGMRRRCPGSMPRTLSSTGSTTISDTFPGTYDSSREATMSETDAPWPRSKRGYSSSPQKMPTYDIAYAGPRNRYTIRTAHGPIIVHNCGYGVGHHKLRLFLKMQAGVEVDLNEAKRIIDIYRGTNNKISGLWRDAQDMLRYLVSGQSVQFGRPGVLTVNADEGGVRLPSGLYIRYPNLKMDRTDTGTEFHYKVRKGRNYIYGGKCLAGDTEVLTDRGWVQLCAITRAHKVWDGVQWVTHAGLTYQGKKITTVVNGVRMTPDHNVLTERGWRCASSSEGLHRAGFWLPDGTAVSGDKWPTITMGLPVQLRDGSFSGGYRRGEVRPSWGAFVVRLQSWGREQIARVVEASGLLGVAVYTRPLPFTYPSSVVQLWGSGHQGLLGMGAVVRDLLGGHGADIPGGPDARPQGQQWGLYTGELPLGDSSGPSGKPQGLAPSGYSQGTPDDGYFQINTAVSLEPEPVYDLLNAGPNTRFVVRGSSGPFIVHNCVENVTQALARCIVGEQMLKIAEKYRVVLTVHDSVVCCVRENEAEEAQAYVEQCMRWTPDWATGLPVNCESDIGRRYGE